jgi:hypothetical protein
MKKVFSSMLILFALLYTAKAQDIELPRVSPKASCGFTIGLTSVNVTYGAPAVKGRVVWGGLVPYGEVWRAGANEATTIEFSTDVNMEGQALKAGKYSLFFIPGEKEWTVIVNKVWNQWGAYKYDETEDAIRFVVEPKMNESMQERLTYTITDMKADMGYIKLAWEKMRLYMRFKVDLVAPVMANINATLDTVAANKKWIVYATGAEFLLQSDANIDEAYDWAKKSTDLFGSCWNWYVRGQIEAKKGDYVAAVASGTKSIELGMAFDEDEYYKEHSEEISAAVQAWAAKMN